MNDHCNKIFTKNISNKPSGYISIIIAEKHDKLIEKSYKYVIKRT